jgi:hypothetical protein
VTISIATLELDASPAPVINLMAGVIKRARRDNGYLWSGIALATSPARPRSAPIPMSSDPIPTDRADAFKKAVVVFHSWTVEEGRDSAMEPEIVQRHSISAVCNFVEAFSDPMPDVVYKFLCWLAAEQSGAAPDDHSYTSGARCLRALRDKHMKGEEKKIRAGGVDRGK